MECCCTCESPSLSDGSVLGTTNLGEKQTTMSLYITPYDCCILVFAVSVQGISIW